MEHQKITGRQSAAAFATTSDDAEILEAFEIVRAARAKLYANDGAVPGLPDGEANRLEVLCLEAEVGVTNNWARTPSGIASRLMLAIPIAVEDRWVDATLTQHGLLALYNARQKLCPNDAQLVQAAYELLHLEWDMALALYKASAAQFESTLRLKSMVETYANRLGESGKAIDPFFSDLERRLDELEAEDSNEDEIARLFATLAPDLTAYKEKVTIAVAQGLEKEVAVHLVRDANFLFAAATPILQPAKEA